MEIGKKNISFGWLWIMIGIIVGAVIGMWSFNGPLASPLGNYTSLARRMIRLSHIAFIALAIINILYGYEIDKTKLKTKLKKIGSWFMIYGTILMPVLLIISAFLESIKYLTVIPTILISISLFIIIIGKI
ncbi:hypothetical protein GF386_03220 [Candidatus Pacearchaeota archaeon]|nr:hypothetical protein [Candidatus Pacearchaeota archaeon]MBD3283151.1 hypothetical protein [Candidatus Pacearchaeota archaeon]